jgi:hypothetical protein
MITGLVVVPIVAAVVALAVLAARRRRQEIESAEGRDWSRRRGREGHGRRARRLRGLAHQTPVPRAEETAPPVGGPFLHWVPDHRGGWRLAGDFLRPTEAPRRAVTPRRRRR